MKAKKGVNEMNFKNIEKAIRMHKKTSAWNAGVIRYALELVEDLQEGVRHGYISKDDLCNQRMIEKALLNGAPDWSSYSWGGCSLIYNQEIAERLCNPSELNITRNGQ